MGAFRWISDDVISEAWDLRRDGWKLAAPDEVAVRCIAVIDAGGLDRVEWGRLLTSTCHEARRLMLVSGVNAPGERAELLQSGFGDAVGDGTSTVEYHARARRLLDLTSWVPRQRVIGPIRLDLLTRKAFADNKTLDLNPREFGLLWRLADTLGRPVSKQTLIQDVWQLGFMPETNSIAVQMSRLRSKLSVAGLSHLVTTANGGYCLSLPEPTSLQLPTYRLR
ncbi:winged helix-turn-helix domain-containing protein [Novosphingobium sp. RD2P27]|uniref:Winged helix-turn-helix domain-containing protein n=1 Tax=Novosphingobium kalidii TaxID=3230299 RepID=A0ABV2D5F2_9SPHN